MICDICRRERETTKVVAVYDRSVPVCATCQLRMLDKGDEEFLAMLEAWIAKLDA